MKLFNDSINLTKADIDKSKIQKDGFDTIFYPIDNNTIKSNFESKYEERKVKKMFLIWVGELERFVLYVDYDNGEFIQITDKSVYSFILTESEREILHKIAA